MTHISEKQHSISPHRKPLCRTRHLLMASTAFTLLLQQGAMAQAVIDDRSHTVTSAAATNGNFGTNSLTIGNVGTGSLTVESGGAASNTSGYIGRFDNSTGTVTITGTGSTWTNSAELYIGNRGNGLLSIENGGSVSNTDSYIGYFKNSSTTSTGEVSVTGTGSTWTNSQGLNVGYLSNGTLTIAGGGSVGNTNGTIGYAAGSTGEVIVTGTDANGTASTWTNDGELYVGNAGNGSLTITGGGKVSNQDGSIGANADSTSTVIVTGTDANGTASTWTNDGELYVGDAGNGSLSIMDGGEVSNRDGYIGAHANSIGTVIVTGADSSGNASTWTNSRDLYLGRYGTGTLTISGGGKVSNREGFVGYLSDPNSNAVGTGTVTVTGTGSAWTNTSTLSIGESGNGTLSIENGGAVSSAKGYVGSEDGRGAVTVTGAGSTWTNSGDMSVGRSGNGTLTVAEAGSVRNGNAYIGASSRSTGTVTVTGPGSTWSNGSLTVGRNGTGTLRIENGGSVTNTTYSYIGDQIGGLGSVTVTGPNSTWTNSGYLVVGRSGTGTLRIENGGSVTNTHGSIVDDYGTGSVTVTGAGSSWTNSEALYIGTYGTGSLTIADGGEVRVGTAGPDGSYNGKVGLASSGDNASGTINIGAESGSSAAAAGKLNAASLEFGWGNAKLVFNHTNTDYDFSTAAFTQSDAVRLGTIEHLAGSTKLSGDSSAFRGETNISGGTLYVTGSLGGTINALTGGTLAGTGIIGARDSMITIGDGGRLSPGLDGSVGTLTMNGTLNFASGSTYVVQLLGSNSDAINLMGTVTIASGATLQISGTATAQSYTILTASTVTGTFSTVDWGGETGYMLAYGDSGTMTLVRTDSSSPQTPGQPSTPSTPSTPSVLSARTPNQWSVASVIKTGRAPAGLLSAVTALNPEQRSETLQQLSGQSHADVHGSLLKVTNVVNNTINARIRAVSGGVAAPAVPALGYAEEKKTVADDRFAAVDNRAKAEVEDLERFGLWANGFGSWGELGATNGGTSTDTASAGLLLGGDAVVVDNLRVGVFGGFSRSFFDASGSNGNSSNYHVGAYAGSSWDALSLRAGVSYTWHDVSSDRAINALNETVSGRYDAGSLNTFGEIGYSIETAHAAFEPFAGLAHTHMTTDSFTETGGVSALTVNGTTSDTTYTTLGMRASTEVSLGSVNASLRGSLGWLYAFGDLDATRTARFATGSNFTVTGTPLDRNAALVETGIDFSLTPSATLGITYSGQFGENAREHGANARLRVQF